MASPCFDDGSNHFIVGGSLLFSEFGLRSQYGQTIEAAAPLKSPAASNTAPDALAALGTSRTAHRTAQSANTPTEPDTANPAAPFFWLNHVTTAEPDVSSADDFTKKCLGASPTMEALIFCREALLTYPADPRIQYQLALALESQGSYDEATRLLHRAADSGYAPAQTRLDSLQAQRQKPSMDELRSTIDKYNEKARDIIRSMR